MTAVIVSPKYQIVIPRDVRESLNIQPGQRVQVFELEGRIEVIPVRPIEEMLGCFPGIDTTVERDEDRAEGQG